MVSKSPLISLIENSLSKIVDEINIVDIITGYITTTCYECNEITSIDEGEIINIPMYSSVSCDKHKDILSNDLSKFMCSKCICGSCCSCCDDYCCDDCDNKYGCDDCDSVMCECCSSSDLFWCCGCESKYCCRTIYEVDGDPYCDGCVKIIHFKDR